MHSSLVRDNNSRMLAHTAALNTLPSGQLDTGTRPKQPRYQKINSRELSLDLHLHVNTGSTSLHLVCLFINRSHLVTRNLVNICKMSDAFPRTLGKSSGGLTSSSGCKNRRPSGMEKCFYHRCGSSCCFASHRLLETQAGGNT